MNVRIKAEDLRRFSASAFERSGMSPDRAALTADVLVWADLRGVASHGVSRLSNYLKWIELGILNPQPNIAVRQEAMCAVVLDADRAAGAVAMSAALDAATEKARVGGIGLAFARGMTHGGALGYYTSIGAERGLACLAASASIPLMPYHGATPAALGTNPLSIAVPGADQEPLVLDMASSAISLGALEQARQTGRTLAPGSAQDADGRPTTDPASAALTLPLGGAKGSGLSLMIECIASLIAGNPIIAAALQEGTGRARHRQNGFVIAIDIGRFCALDTFRSEVERLAHALKALPPQPGTDRIYMPGERGFRAAEAHSTAGVPIAARLWSELEALGRRLEIDLPPLLSSEEPRAAR